MREAILVLFIARVSLATTPLYLLGLYPMTGTYWPGGQAMLPASQLAVRDINKNASILGDYELKIIVKDTKVRRDGILFLIVFVDVLRAQTLFTKSNYLEHCNFRSNYAIYIMGYILERK